MIFFVLLNNKMKYNKRNKKKCFFLLLFFYINTTLILNGILMDFYSEWVSEKKRNNTWKFFWNKYYFNLFDDRKNKIK